MIPRRVDQLLAGFADGDAISREARCVREVLRGMGIESDIHVSPDRVGEAVSGMCCSLEDYVATREDMVLYHYSMASPATDVFLGSPARKVVRYHNITPAEFFVGYDDDIAGRLRESREALSRVVSGAEAVWADSAFNASDVGGSNSVRVSVVPLFFRTSEWEIEPDPSTMVELGDSLKNILFVGRMVPNKCIEELVLAFAWYHKCIDARSRLVLVGSERSCPRYFAMLRMLAGQLGLSNVYFKGFLSEAQLAACYRTADVFVSTSRHEGFCLPLVEAAFHGVPVVARDSGGMPEALASSGVLFDEAEPRVLAELIARVLGDELLRCEVLDSQSERVKGIAARDLAGEFRLLLDELGDG